jgi:hypothetical protein
MKWSLLTPLLAITLASPALAEKLTFDHRTYPPLEAMLDSGRSEMIRFDNSNPKLVIDRIAIQGTSVDHWTEALDIIVRARGGKFRTTADWVKDIQQQSQKLCPSTFTTIAEDARSLTFERHSTGCPSSVAPSALYRIVAGNKSLFMLNALTMGELTEAARQQWLTLLASAHLDP